LAEIAVKLLFWRETSLQTCLITILVKRCNRQLC